MTPMDDLIARLEGGEGEDRRLDFAIVDFFAPLPDGRVPLPWLHCYTASLDAAVAFVERMLPGCTGWDIGFVAGNEPPHDVKLWRDLATRPISASAKSPARALMAAALRALAQKDQDNG